MFKTGYCRGSLTAKRSVSVTGVSQRDLVFLSWEVGSNIICIYSSFAVVYDDWIPGRLFRNVVHRTGLTEYLVAFLHSRRVAQTFGL